MYGVLSTYTFRKSEKNITSYTFLLNFEIVESLQCFCNYLLDLNLIDDSKAGFKWMNSDALRKHLWVPTVMTKQTSISKLNQVRLHLI